MKAIFEEEQEREWNKLNRNSVKLRSMDLDEIDKMQGIVFFDDNNKRISDAEIYLPQDKAYIVINRVHFGEVGKAFDEDKKEILKRMISYFLYPGNLEYLASAIYIKLVGSGISNDIAEELGFYPQGNYSTGIVRLLNKDFERFLEHTPIGEEVKNKILKAYRELRVKDQDYLDIIRKQLEKTREYLQIFINKGDEVMIEAKKVEIKHYEAILGIEQKDKEDRL